MQRVAGLFLRPDIAPYTDSTLQSSDASGIYPSRLIDGLWGPGSLSVTSGWNYVNDSYGVDIGVSQRITQVDLVGYSASSVVNARWSVFVSENNSYWTLMGTYDVVGTLIQTGYFRHTISLPSNCIGRYLKCTCLANLSGYLTVKEVEVFGIEGKGSGDLPFIDSGADALYLHGATDLPFFDCYYYSGTGYTDLPFFDIFVHGWVETLAESDLPFFDCLAGANASAYTDLLFYDTETLNFKYGQVTGEASVDLPFFDSEGLYNPKYNGDLPFYDSEILAFTKGSSGLGFTDIPFYDSISLSFKKGIGGTSKVDLPFFDSCTIKVSHIAKGKTDLPFFDSVSTVGIIGTPAIPDNPGIPADLGDEIPVIPRVSLRYYNVF